MRQNKLKVIHTMTLGKKLMIVKEVNIFAKGYTPNWSKEIYVIKKLKIQFHGHINDLNGKKNLLEHFMKKNFKN